MTEYRTLILTGPVGVGKTSIAHAIADILKERSIPNAVVDLDALRDAFPKPKDDPFHMEMGYKNLASVWRNYKEDGVTHLVIPNVVERKEDIEKVKQAVPNSHVSIVRLTADIETIHNRLKEREGGDILQWHINRATQLHQELYDSALEDFVVDTENKSAEEISREIISRLGWF